ncbi:GTPase-activating protein gyp1 [Diplonema papillatum]|nr:GTPase-activating protein gyp1 [Diplonema papillatum]
MAAKVSKPAAWRGGAPERKRWSPPGFPGAIVTVRSATAAVEEAFSCSLKRGSADGESIDCVSVGSRSSLSMKSRKPESPRSKKFSDMLSAENVDLGVNCDHGLRALAWNGIPAAHRPKGWKVLSGHLPTSRARMQKELARKRSEYKEYVVQYYEVDGMILSDGTHLCSPDPMMGATEQELRMRRQIHIDVPRTCQEYAAFQTPFIQNAMERLLYIWSIRHPASGYVQGINDLTTPFFAVFLGEFLNTEQLLTSPASECQTMFDEYMDDECRLGIEADTFWCLSHILRFVQDNYTFAQPGTQRMVQHLQGIVTALDPPLAQHFEDHSIDFLQFSFRWMNCLLVRELPLHLVIRLWDTYLAEGEHFPTLHVYVCAALLLHWSPSLLKMDFAEMMLFLQSLNKRHVYQKDLEKWISHAYVMLHTFEDSNQFKNANRSY